MRETREGLKIPPSGSYKPAIREKETLLSLETTLDTTINSNGVAHDFPGHAGGGGLFRDSKGDMLGCFATYLNIPDSLYAELFTAIMAIQIANSKGWKVVWLECDSSMVVEIFKGNMAPPWKLRNYWEHCRRIIQSLRFKASHIFREGNSCADKVATFGVRSRTDYWWNLVPPFLSNDFNRNGNLLPNYRFKNL
ncbi:PREDICTED: uncharacterized protein LOC109353821 [Lupinus angustifolius]|uniref:uncharacterized protein LOC109353821 n=1 Tax=Lupinus angustifolius TaxID=3871 RepID=UPI00092E5F60|nr:PREDICTED: uncharacterized protein LOC109353821 [Lupinus angustifolius]